MVTNQDRLFNTVLALIYIDIYMDVISLWSIGSPTLHSHFFSFLLYLVFFLWPIAKPLEFDLTSNKNYLIFNWIKHVHYTFNCLKYFLLCEYCRYWPKIDVSIKFNWIMWIIFFPLSHNEIVDSNINGQICVCPWVASLSIESCNYSISSSICLLLIFI